MPNEPKPAAEKRPPTKRREHDQGDHEGSAHTPDEFDVMKPDTTPAKPKTPSTSR